MSRIKSKGSLIERIAEKALKKRKLKFTPHPKSIIGKPDFVLPESRIAIFCDSSFWHGYKKMTTLRHDFKRNRKFWIKKILANIDRDKKVNRLLRRDGWKVIRFWDFQIKGNVEKCIDRIQKIILK